VIKEVVSVITVWEKAGIKNMQDNAAASKKAFKKIFKVFGIVTPLLCFR
jgi:hypothetical protein